MYCGEKGAYAHITRVHDKKCLKKIHYCPNFWCIDTMQRQHINKHVTTECEYTVIPCKFKRLGCERKLKRKDMAAHEEDDKLHLQRERERERERERDLHIALVGIQCIHSNSCALCGL